MEWQQGELFPGIGFLMAYIQSEPSSIPGSDNKRGRCERYVREGRHALN